MLGRRVRLILTAPKEEVSGELRQQNVEGVWIYGGFKEQADSGSIRSIASSKSKDAGPIYR